MPNHVSNRLTITGDATSLQSLIEYVKLETSKENSDFSFDKINPCPAEIKNRTSPFRSEDGDHLPEDKMRQYLTDKYGATNWYEWNIAHWGTKWDAYDISMEEYLVGNKVVYNFDTAWSTPAPVIEFLSNRFPALVFQLQWADEDTGQNTGDVTFQWGHLTIDNCPQEGSKEAYEMYFDLKGNGEDFTWDEEKGRYVHCEEVDEEAAA